MTPEAPPSDRRHRWTLTTGLTLAVVTMLVTHPVAIVALLALTVVYAVRAGTHRLAPILFKAAGGLALAVLLFNALFSWNGAGVLWQAPFLIDLLGRPRLTVQAIAWGLVGGLQLGSVVLSLGTATLAVPPQTFHRALSRLGLPRSVATAGGLALRLVPDIRRDAEAMRGALRTRGVRTDGLRGTSKVLVPLTARSLDRALVAEEALTLRGFSAEGHDRRTLPGLAAGLGLAAAGVAGLVAFLGPGRPAFYPTLQMPLGLVDLALIAGLLLLPTVLVLGVDRSSA